MSSSDRQPNPSGLAEDTQPALAEALQFTASAINQSLNLREVLERILDVIGKIVPNDAANIMLNEPAGARMAAWRGYDHLKGINLSDQVRSINDVPNLRRMVETQMPIVVPDTSQSENWVNLNTSYWIKSYLSAPICNNGKTIGFINLNSRTPGFYSDQHARNLLAFADQAAIAIKNASLYERTQQELAERKKAEEALRQAKAELEVRVEQRTAALRKSNEQLKKVLTLRQEAEYSLKEERALLALRVEERTAELSVANAELAQAAQLKDAFLASMSHELRTPLSTILNIAETMQEQVYGPLNGTQQKSMQTLLDSGEHLLLLINDILDLSKIGAGKLDLILDTVPVEQVCQASLQFIKESARAKHLAVSISIDPQVTVLQADPRRFKQILVNLLTNAVKFTPEGGSVGLIVTGDARLKQAHFTVWDCGIGIPEEKLELLFKPFSQIDNRLSRRYEGTGLGLALVYHLVEMHGGGISVESEPGAGSRFTISLNWQEQAPSPAQTDVTVHPQVIPLDDSDIVEGMSDTMLQLRACLSGLGIETSVFPFEKQSVHSVIALGFDLFVLDLGLLINGREILAMIKNNPASSATPMLIVTHSRSALDRPSLPAGIGYLDAPFTSNEVIKLIRDLSPLGTASLQRKAAIFVEQNQDPQQQPLILIADDRPASIRSLIDDLAAAEYRTVVVSSAMDVNEQAREQNPDLILMNVHMSGLNEIAAIKRIRRNPQLKDTPIIAITSLEIPKDRENCLQAGASAYIRKPIDPKLLCAIIYRHIQVKSRSAVQHKNQRQDN